MWRQCFSEEPAPRNVLSSPKTDHLSAFYFWAHPPCCFPEPWEQAFIPWCESVSREFHIPCCPHPGNRGQTQLPVVGNSDQNPPASGVWVSPETLLTWLGGGHFPRTYEGPQKQGKITSSCSKECWKQSFSYLSFEFKLWVPEEMRTPLTGLIK